MGWFRWRPYVSVARRQANAAKKIKAMEKRGYQSQPIRIEGRTIAETFWGKAWCEHLESFSDFSNRLPRGRAYVRNGSVVDLRIEAGKITALVAGSDMYTVNIDIDAVPAKSWKNIQRQCCSQIGSLVELLQGRLSQAVMGIITHQKNGLFPVPKQIKMRCSCPDWANMCKHVAAVLYGVGARLDTQPELLFLLRKVDHLELIDSAGELPDLPATTAQETISSAELGDVFGIEIERSAEEAPVRLKKSVGRSPRVSARPTAQKSSAARKEKTPTVTRKKRGMAKTSG